MPARSPGFPGQRLQIGGRLGVSAQSDQRDRGAVPGWRAAVAPLPPRRLVERGLRVCLRPVHATVVGGAPLGLPIRRRRGGGAGRDQRGDGHGEDSVNASVTSGAYRSGATSKDDGHDEHRPRHGGGQPSALARGGRPVARDRARVAQPAQRLDGDRRDLPGPAFRPAARRSVHRVRDARPRRRAAHAAALRPVVAGGPGRPLAGHDAGRRGAVGRRPSVRPDGRGARRDALARHARRRFPRSGSRPRR